MIRGGVRGTVRLTYIKRGRGVRIGIGERVRRIVGGKE
jgi:hypothetical protein